MEGAEQGPEDIQVDGIEEVSVPSEGFDFSVILFTIIVGAAVFYYFWNKVYHLVLKNRGKRQMGALIQLDQIPNKLHHLHQLQNHLLISKKFGNKGS